MFMGIFAVRKLDYQCQVVLARTGVAYARLDGYGTCLPDKEEIKRILGIQTQMVDMWRKHGALQRMGDISCAMV